MVARQRKPMPPLAGALAAGGGGGGGGEGLSASTPLPERARGLRTVSAIAEAHDAESDAKLSARERHWRDMYQARDMRMHL